MIDPGTMYAWPEVAHLETDRLCDRCGYNLHGQSVRREPATELLLVRCPECGRMAAAGDHTLVGQVWMRRLMTVMMGLWVAGLIVIGLWFIVFEWVMGFVIISEMAHWDLEEVIPCISFVVIIAFLFISMLTALAPHWGRGTYFGAAIIHTMALAFSIGWFVLVFDPRRTLDVFGFLPSVAAIHMAAGLMGAAQGRRFMRWVVCVIVPPKHRSALGYLWTVDGLPAPREGGHAREQTQTVDPMVGPSAQGELAASRSEPASAD